MSHVDVAERPISQQFESSDMDSGAMWPRAAARQFACALLVVTALRMAAAFSIPLSGDEAYYWAWTQHLALGYHDHPPMVAWVVALSTSLFGPSTWVVRLPFVLMGSGTAWLSFVLGWEVTRRVDAALWAGGLALIVPLFTLAGLAVFPDSPMLLACAGFFVCAWRAVESRRAPWWVAAGACAGAAALSKLTGLYLMPALFVFLALSQRHRCTLTSRGPWLMIGAALLIASPYVYWNITHGFEAAAYQFSSRLGASQGRKLYTLTFVGLSAAAVSPVLYFMLAWAVLRAGVLGWRERNAGLLYLFCMAAPLHAVFLTCSLLTKIGLHWTAPGTLAAFSAFREAWPSRTWRTVGAGLAVVFSGLVYFFAFSPDTLAGLVSGGVQAVGINHGRPLKTQEITEILGYPEASALVGDVAAASPTEPFLITTNYALSSVLWFYSGRPFHVIMGSRIGAQYDHWDHFPSMLGRDAIYVDTTPVDQREDVWERLHEAFEEVTLAPPLVTYGRGVEARTYYLARCRNFRNDVFTALQSIHRR